MANSYNVTALPNYVEEHKTELISKAVLDAVSANLFTLLTGVKGPTALNLIATDVVFGCGNTCGWDEAGASTLSQRVLTPQTLKVNMAICDKVLLDKYANYLVRVEANKTDRDLPFEQEFVDSVIKGVKEKLETMIYQGTGSDCQFEGLISILGEATGTIDVTLTGTAKDKVMAVYMAMPQEVITKDDAVILVDPSIFRAYVQALVADNLYHYNPGTPVTEVYIPGTQVRVIMAPGLASTNAIIGAALSNLFYGTNLQDGEEIFDLWYSKDNREFRLAIEFTAGVQVAFPDEVVLGTV